jgi:hypothetical protein
MSAQIKNIDEVRKKNIFRIQSDIGILKKVFFFNFS